MLVIESKKVEERVLKRIKPSKEEIEKSREIAKKFIKEIEKRGHEAILVGSVARDTFISGDKDIDVFFFFDPEVSRAELERRGLEIGKSVLANYNPKTHYAEHPYTKAVVEGYEVEIVPCYKIKTGKIISAVDRTPLHTEYVLKKLKGEHKHEVILLKQFLKAFDGYGADAKVKGFSGYLCELLIITNKSLDELLKNAAHDWKKKIVIDLEKSRESYDKFPEPLVVIDPVDRDRNVATAVDRTILSKFIIKAREYLVKPSEEFFFPSKKPINIKRLVKGRNLLVISFKYPQDVIEEIAWSQLEKLTKIIKNQLYENEFRVYRSTYWTDEKKKCAIALELMTHELDEHMIHKGPEVWDEENSKAFIEKNPEYFVRRSRLFSWKKRDFRKAEDLVRHLLKKSDLVPSHLQKKAKKCKIRVNEKTLKEKEVLRKFFGW